VCYPTAGISSAAGPRSVCWDEGYNNDGPAPAPLELGVTGPVVTPIQGQTDIAHDWWLSALWTPPIPVMATEWRDSLTSGQVVALFGYDPSVNWAAVGTREVTAAIVEYLRIMLAGVVPPCLESPRTRAKQFHAALRRVLRQAGRPVHVWEYRSHDWGRPPCPFGAVLASTALGRRPPRHKVATVALCFLSPMRPAVDSRVVRPLPVCRPARLYRPIDPSKPRETTTPPPAAPSRCADPKS